eukprot:3703726-Rhodomonas_salina.1
MGAGGADKISERRRHRDRQTETHTNTHTHSQIKPPPIWYKRGGAQTGGTGRTSESCRLPWRLRAQATGASLRNRMRSEIQYKKPQFQCNLYQERGFLYLISHCA